MDDQAVQNDLSDDDLPAIDLTPSKVKDFEESSIVWVKWKTNYWPALIRKVYAKAKKIAIVFADQPTDNRGKEYRITFPFSKVVKFDSSSRSKQLLAEGLKGCEELREAVEKCRDYTIKLALNSLHVSPLEFMQNPNGNVLAQYKRQLESKTSAKRKLNLDNKGNEDFVHTKKQKVESREDEEEEDNQNNLPEQADTDEEGSSTDDLQQKSTRNENGDQFANDVIRVIKSDSCQQHLRDIYNEKQNSKRHKWFMAGTLSERRQLKYVQFTHMLSENELEDVLSFLRKEMEKLSNASRYCILNYTLDVWIPESLIFALQSLLHVTYTRAEISLLTGELPQSLDEA